MIEIVRSIKMKSESYQSRSSREGGLVPGNTASPLKCLNL
jgi:hypothetical protein